MIYPDNFEAKTGFTKIRERLHSNTLSALGDEWVDELNFQTKYEEIIIQLNQVNEFANILNDDKFPQDAFFDMRETLSKISIEGAFVEEGELFNLRRALETIGLIQKYFQEKEESECYYLKELTKDIFTFPDIIRLIDRVLDKFGKIKDNATPELASIRKRILVAESSISKTISAVMQKARIDGWIEAETKPSVRDGRLVIPINAMHKRKIKGIVHDESATGKTVYIEPEEAVEINNKIREFISEEKREIIKILTSICDEIRPRTEEMLDSFRYLGQIDFIRAKAIFANETGSVLPKIRQETIIDWSEAKHPILYLNHQKLGKEVVPLNILLNKQNRILLISGPNAGGKSVCLKTVGLLQYMMQCGLLVPMHKDSVMGVFDSIFIDIGDEQSIENDLSTYSSHLTNMKHFVRNANDKSILLIDEFGSGTEPQIGGAIAEALLDLFNQKRSFGVITTHYTNLKNFATDTDGIINGAMLYDRHEMRPLFRLEIGNPGSSFAVEIARKIGLPETVIEQAIAIVGSDHVNLDKYLQDIIRDKRYWEGKRQAIRQKEKKIDELTTKYESELEDISTQRKAIIREAKQESKRILQEANAVVENTVRRIKEAQAGKEETKEARRLLENYKKEAKESDEKKDLLDLKIERIRQKKNQRDLQKEKMEIEKTLPAIGQNVRIKGHGGLGTLIEIKGGNATVAFGLMKTATKLSELEIVSNTELKRELKKEQAASNTTNIIHQKNIQFKREIDVRGMRGDEALQAVTYFIDDALILDVDQVRILHGTGNGILRQLIRDYLKSIPSVLQATDERVDLGGAGITVVKFQ